jgi:hypothetical protein
VEYTTKLYKSINKEMEKEMNKEKGNDWNNSGNSILSYCDINNLVIRLLFN